MPVIMTSVWPLEAPGNNSLILRGLLYAGPFFYCKLWHGNYCRGVKKSG